MTWVAWRVQRPQYVAAAVAVAVLMVRLAASGLDRQARWSQMSDTGDVYVLYALPGPLGLAVGAAVVAAEAGGGTDRVAWTQSISRARWLTGKLAVGALVSARHFGITGVVSIGYVLFA